MWAHGTCRGGTVLFGERVVDAVKRVARGEMGVDVEVQELLGYIEYPSHYKAGLDSPVGLAFRTRILGPAEDELPEGCAWFKQLPGGLYREQHEFLTQHFGFTPSPRDFRRVPAPGPPKGPRRPRGLR
jgi:8-oxo-dGTP diphosphatase